MCAEEHSCSRTQPWMCRVGVRAHAVIKSAPPPECLTTWTQLALTAAWSKPELGLAKPNLLLIKSRWKYVQKGCRMWMHPFFHPISWICYRLPPHPGWEGLLFPSPSLVLGWVENVSYESPSFVNCSKEWKLITLGTFSQVKKCAKVPGKRRRIKPAQLQGDSPTSFYANYPTVVRICDSRTVL